MQKQVKLIPIARANTRDFEQEIDPNIKSRYFIKKTGNGKTNFRYTLFKIYEPYKKAILQHHIFLKRVGGK